MLQPTIKGQKTLKLIILWGLGVMIYRITSSLFTISFDKATDSKKFTGMRSYCRS